MDDAPDLPAHEPLQRDVVAVRGRRAHDDVPGHGRHLAARPRTKPRRLVAGGEVPHRLAQHAPVQGHPLVGGPEPFVGVHRDRSLGDLRLVVAGHRLAFLVRPLNAGLPDEVHLVQADLRAVALAVEVELLAEVAPGDDPAPGVVHRHRPLGDAHAGEELLPVRVLEDVRRLRDGGEQDLGGAHPDEVLPAAHVGEVDPGAVLERMPVHHRHGAPGRVEVRAGHPGVQEHAVERVHWVLGHLEPVARVVDGVGHELDPGQREGVEHGEFGPQLGRTEVGEDEAGELPDGIGAVAELARDGARRRLAGRFQDGAVHVEQPAMVAAPDAALGDDPVLQRRPAVAAMLVQQAEPPGEIPEQHQLLAQHPDEDGTLPDLLAHRHRHPEAPEVFAARGMRAGMGQLRVRARVRDAVVAVVAPGELSGGRGHVSVARRDGAAPRLGAGGARFFQGLNASPSRINEDDSISIVANGVRQFTLTSRITPSRRLRLLTGIRKIRKRLPPSHP